MIPGFLWALPTALIAQYSAEYDLNKNVVAAVVSTESSGDPSATRYEPHYRWTLEVYEYAKSNGITQQTEEMHQKTSWGLMQIMGATARELGFSGNIPDLVDPKLGLKYGCLYLRKQYQKYGNWDDAIAAYNAGRAVKLKSGVYLNEQYVDKVIGKARQLGFRTQGE